GVVLPAMSSGAAHVVLDGYSHGTIIARDAADVSLPPKGKVTFTLVACAGGSLGDGKTCAPIGSCNAGGGGWHANASCISTGQGQNSCVCHSGFLGDGTTCAACDVCANGQYTSGACTAATNTQCADCNAPKPGQFVSATCRAGSSVKPGVDTGLTACSNPADG